MRNPKIAVLVFLSLLFIGTLEVVGGVSVNQKKFVYFSKGMLKEHNIDVKRVKFDRGNVVFYTEIKKGSSTTVWNIIGGAARLIYEEGAEKIGVNKCLVVIVDLYDGGKQTAAIPISKIKQLGDGKLNYEEFTKKVQLKTYSSEKVAQIREKRAKQNTIKSQEDKETGSTPQQLAGWGSSTSDNTSSTGSDVDFNAVKEINTSCNKEFSEIDRIIIKLKNADTAFKKSAFARKIKSILTSISIKALGGFGKNADDSLSMLKAYFYQAYYAEYLEYKTDVSHLFDQVILSAKQRLKHDKLTPQQKKAMEILIGESEKAKANKKTSAKSESSFDQKRGLGLKWEYDWTLKNYYMRLDKVSQSKQKDLCRNAIENFNNIIDSDIDPKDILTRQASCYYMAQCYKRLGEIDNYNKALKKVLEYPLPTGDYADNQTVYLMRQLRHRAEDELKPGGKVSSFKTGTSNSASKKTGKASEGSGAEEAFCKVMSITYNKIPGAKGTEKANYCRQSILGFNIAISKCTAPKEMGTLQACWYYKAQCYKELGKKANYKRALERVSKMYPDAGTAKSQPQAESFMKSLRQKAEKELNNM